MASYLHQSLGVLLADDIRPAYAGLLHDVVADTLKQLASDKQELETKIQ